jgi:hypothetical protein
MIHRSQRIITMLKHPLGLSLAVVAALLLTANCAWGLGEILGQSKEELKLKYDVTVHDPANGQVGVEFTLTDEGRLKPLDSIDLMIPKEDGSGTYDLSVPLAMRQTNGKQVARFNLKKDWAARAEIWFTTYHFDGKQLVMTRYHHVIPVARYMNNPPAKDAKPAAAPAGEPAADAPARPAAKAKGE